MYRIGEFPIVLSVTKTKEIIFLISFVEEEDNKAFFISKDSGIQKKDNEILKYIVYIWFIIL